MAAKKSYGVSGILMLTVFLSSFFISIDANAIPFNGRAWVAQHLFHGDPTGHFLFVIEPAEGMSIDAASVKLKKNKNKYFKIEQSDPGLNFYELTGVDKKDQDDLNLLQFDITNFKLKNKYKFSFKYETNNKLFKGKGVTTYSTFNNPVGVPEPGTIMLFGAGLIGLAVYGRKKLKSTKFLND